MVRRLHSLLFLSLGPALLLGSFADAQKRATPIPEYREDVRLPPQYAGAYTLIAMPERGCTVRYQFILAFREDAPVVEYRIARQSGCMDYSGSVPKSRWIGLKEVTIRGNTLSGVIPEQQLKDSPLKNPVHGSFVKDRSGKSCLLVDGRAYRRRE
jgi:hypothetical protein